MSIEIDKTYSVRYPFFRTTYSGINEDGPYQEESWRPGCDHEQDDNGDVDWFSEGHGQMHLTVVCEFKPGRFPTRVFFTRKWQDPDGKQFGLPKLRMTTKTNFMKLLKGYRREYIHEDM